MRNIRLELEFDGTDFAGWQRQPGARTVQGTLEAAIATVLRHPAEAWGCARTDAGVHATGYVANFHSDSDILAPRLLASLNGVLPEDVVVVAVADAPAGFHARFSARARRYVYRIATRPTAVWRRFAWQTRHRLDPALMAEGAKHILGERDFTSFTALANQANPFCAVTEVAVTREEGLITLTVEANRFLYHMVRVIAGTLVEVGRGRMAPERVAEVLRTRDRRAAGPTAPALGLMLVGVRYE
jgi:tRNA pseudouridine38-40 synthase